MNFQLKEQIVLVELDSLHLTDLELLLRNSQIRQLVLSKKKSLQGTNIYVREDFSDKIEAKRTELLPQMYEPRQNHMIAFLQYDRFITYPRSTRMANTGEERSEMSEVAGRPYPDLTVNMNEDQ